MKNDNLYLMISLPALSSFSSLSCLAVRATPSLSSLSFFASCLSSFAFWRDFLFFGATGWLLALLFLLTSSLFINTIGSFPH